jgi:Family of unknown function (DUF5763)
MEHCQATTKQGKPCRAAASVNGLCSLHANPTRARQLGQVGGSRNRRPEGVDFRLSDNPSLADRSEILTRSINAVLAGELHPRKAIAVGNLMKLQSAIALDLELENRVAELERAMRERTSESFSNSSTPTAGSQDESVPGGKSQTSQVDVQKVTASPSGETAESPETLEDMKVIASEKASEENSGAESESPEVN